MLCRPSVTPCQGSCLPKRCMSQQQVFRCQLRPTAKQAQPCSEEDMLASKAHGRQNVSPDAPSACVLEAQTFAAVMPSSLLGRLALERPLVAQWTLSPPTCADRLCRAPACSSVPTIAELTLARLCFIHLPLGLPQVIARLSKSFTAMAKLAALH